jgi:hypothetical protein
MFRRRSSGKKETEQFQNLSKELWIFERMQLIQFLNMAIGLWAGDDAAPLHLLIVPVIVALLVAAGCSLNQDGRAFLPSTDGWLLLLLH